MTLNFLFLIFIILPYFIYSQYAWSLPDNVVHDRVQFTPLNNPTIGVPITTSTLTRPTIGGVVNQVLYGINSLTFTPSNSVSYRVSYTTTATVITITLTLTHPTYFNSISLIYLAYKKFAPTAITFQYFYNSQSFIDLTGSPLISGSGTRQISQTYSINYPSTNPYMDRRINSQQCSTNIVAFTGTSITQYQYSTQCTYNGFIQATTSASFTLKIKVYNDTLASKIGVVFFIWQKYFNEVGRSVQFRYLGTIQFSYGLAVNLVPTYDNTVTTVIFGMSYVTLKYNQQFKYDFDLVSSWLFVPSTRKNVFQITVLSKKTCLNSSQLLNKLTFQCVPSLINTCNPSYVDIYTNQTIANNGIKQFQISKSNRWLAICVGDKVIILKFNGSNFQLYQKLFMATDCTSLDANQDFSVIAVVGTNLFQVYVFNSTSLQYQNFYMFPSQFSTSYSNKQVAITPDAMKIVISTTVSTIVGHMYFIFDRPTNQYVFKRFQNSNANTVYFSKDGKILYVTITNKLIVYRQKQQTLMGNFVIWYVIQTLSGYNTAAGGSWLSDNQQVLIVYVQYIGFKIYHLNSLTGKHQYHSLVVNKYYGNWIYIKIRISSDGLRFCAGFTLINMFMLYQRASMNDSFIPIATDGQYMTGGFGNNNGIGVSWDGRVIITTRTLYIMRIFMCSSFVSHTIPPNGYQLIYSKSQEFIEYVNNQTSNSSFITNTTNSTNSTNSTVSNNTFNNISMSMIEYMIGKVKNLQQNQKNIENKQDAIITMIFVVIVSIIGITIIILKKIGVGGAQIGSQNIGNIQNSQNQLRNSNMNDTNTKIELNESHQTLFQQNSHSISQIKNDMNSSQIKDKEPIQINRKNLIKKKRNRSPLNMNVQQITDIVTIQ